jgi:hypothetical protein
MKAQQMADTVRLYIGRSESGDCRYYLADEDGMEDARYVTLSKDDACDYFRMEREYLAWQARLKPLHAASIDKVYADRKEAEERKTLAELRAKYGS